MGALPLIHVFRLSDDGVRCGADGLHDALGYETHHKVEQNPDNVAKSPFAEAVEKFGRSVLDAPSNLAWIPRLKHEQITGYFNSLESSDVSGRLHRDVVNELNFAGQDAAGVEALRRFGVLK